MQSLEGIIAVNKAAVLREYQDAVDSKNTVLALKILKANPDIFAANHPLMFEPTHTDEEIEYEIERELEQTRKDLCRTS